MTAVPAGRREVILPGAATLRGSAVAGDCDGTSGCRCECVQPVSVPMAIKAQVKSECQDLHMLNSRRENGEKCE